MWVVSITSPPSAVLILVILGLQSEQFLKEDVSVVVHPPSEIINFDLGSPALLKSVSELSQLTAANSRFFVIVWDSFSKIIMSLRPSNSIDFQEKSDSSQEIMGLCDSAYLTQQLGRSIPEALNCCDNITGVFQRKSHLFPGFNNPLIRTFGVLFRSDFFDSAV